MSPAVRVQYEPSGGDELSRRGVVGCAVFGGSAVFAFRRGASGPGLLPRPGRRGRSLPRLVPPGPGIEGMGAVLAGYLRD
ncbi:MAG TPA: hypothetical protein VK162_17565 [Streptosporangiaceae bacterium]|nr:hypothetical protein [Streptosporangiaceae bacterium]